MADAASKTIGGFRVLRELKGGAQGVVYKAVCERDDVPTCPRGTVVALKAMTVQDESHERYARLERRTRELIALRHRHIVRYLGCFRQQEPFSELHAIILEYLDGETLKERLERQPGGLDADVAVKVSVAMVSALAAAEARGICHRDIKPANIFLCGNGEVKLLDFEVARLESASPTAGSGRMIGTFDYMAPDFADPAFRGDYRSDVFSAGVVIHEALVGRTPYKPAKETNGQADFVFMSRWAKNPDGTYQDSAVVIAPRIKRLLAHMDVLLEKALSPDRQRRLPTFAAFLEELRKVRFRDLINGDRVYRVLQLVGKGGFGEVFKARDKKSGSLVAVKHLLRAEYSERFRREAKIMTQLKGDCFVRFVDYFVVQHGGSCESFLLMDFLEGMPGSSLKDAIKSAQDAGLPRRDVLRAFARYAHGLAVMHARGIYHRDIKPANLYYPRGSPERSSIMDFGIARDVNGTATTGGVPGTFDYMPPEVVTMQTRGESGMDIYALGLCLYEALTGRTAYPKLPAGTAAYAKFFQRAKTLARPNLDGLTRASDIEILALVRQMTEPDVNARLLDTAELERRLWDLSGEENPYAQSDDQAAETTVSGFVGEYPSPRDRPQGAGDTLQTVVVPTQDLPKLQRLAKSRASRPEPKPEKRDLGPLVKVAATVCILLAIAGGVYSQRGRIRQGVSWAQSEIERRRQTKAEIKSAGIRRDQARQLAKAEREARGILSKYDVESLSAEAIDAEFALWIETWTSVIGTNDISRIVSEQKGLRSRRRDQDAVREKVRAEDARRQSEAEVVTATYEHEGVDEGDRSRDRWLKAWSGSPKEKTEPLLQAILQARDLRQRRDLEAVAYAGAQKAAEGVRASYRSESLDIADRRRGLWESEWRNRLTKEHFGLLSAQLDQARAKCEDRQNESDRQSQEIRLERDCLNLCETLEPVETRRSRLDDADRMLTDGVASGIVREPRLTRLRKAIHERRGWSAFRVANHMEGLVRVGDEAIATGKSRLFVFTNDVPADLCVVCKGFEPYALSRAHDGRTIRISRDMLTVQQVDVTLPELERGVTCRIDGVLAASSVVKLSPGSHVCTYSRPQSRDQTFVFKVDYGTPMNLSGPPGRWQASEELTQRTREAARQHEAKEFTRVCRALMQVEPLSTRRKRLAACDAKLHEWNADSILGSEQIALLRAELARENARVIGIVSNQTTFAASVGGSAQDIKIPARSGLQLSFAYGLPEHASLQVKGYDPVELPDDFDGNVFVLSSKMLVDSPVRITLPELPSGVTCLIDGRPMVSMCELRPGTHTYVYRKGDCADIRKEFTVRNDTPMTLPPPSGWEESTALSSLSSALVALNDGALDKVEKFLEAAEVQSEENMRRKREIERQVALRKRYVALKDEAKTYFEDEMWLDAVRIYAELKRQGYVFPESELKTVAAAYEKGRELCKARRKKAQDSGTAADVEKADEDLRRLHVSYGAIIGKTAE